MQKIYLNIKQLYFFQEFCIEINWYMYIHTYEHQKQHNFFLKKTTTDNTKYQFFFLYLQQNANTLHD